MIHEPLDLKVLDHLERRMPRFQGHVWITQGYVDYIGDRLRPLLDLVYKMGKGLEAVGDMQCLQAFRPDGTCYCPSCSQTEALDAYRRAKGD